MNPARSDFAHTFRHLDGPLQTHLLELSDAATDYGAIRFEHYNRQQDAPLSLGLGFDARPDLPYSRPDLPFSPELQSRLAAASFAQTHQSNRVLLWPVSPDDLTAWTKACTTLGFCHAQAAHKAAHTFSWDPHNLTDAGHAYNRAVGAARSAACDLAVCTSLAVAQAAKTDPRGFALQL